MRDLGIAAAVVVGAAMAFAVATFAIALPTAGPAMKTNRFEITGAGLCAMQDWDNATDACLVWRREESGRLAGRYVTTMRPGPGPNTTTLIRTEVSGEDQWRAP